MINTCPNALRLAAAVAISSSIIVTDAQAGRSLQTKSVDISNNGYRVFTQSLVKVQPTLGNDQQPIPKSFTTIYPDQTPVREGFRVPSDDFTDVFSGVSTLVSIVDLFETGENNVAQKYTKVLKVGDEAVFKFTHSLEEKELVIEVRGGMTDQDIVDTVSDQLACISSLEPSTKLARPEHLYIVLEAANDRAENLGTSDHYVALATIKVEQVEVNGRTFMILISGGDQPPELKRLGQSLFVNDEALLVAATSAYIQVHVLKEELQQESLNNLMAHSKPVGYVVHVEDNPELYPLPAGYPKLEAVQAREDIIVFHGLTQNPADVAFVENLYKLLKEAGTKDPAETVSTKVKKYNVKSYRHIIRSRQMTLLEELAAQHDAEFSKDKLISLAYYESLQQALSSATPKSAYEFEFTSGHFKVTSSVVTSTWMHYQLVKYFGFKRTFKNLLTDQRFIKNMEKVIPIFSDIDKAQADTGDDEKFASKVMEDMSRLLSVTYKNIDELREKEGEFTHILNHLKCIAEIDTGFEREKLRALKLKQQAEDEHAQTRKVLEELQNQSLKMQQEVERIPALQQQVRDAREKVAKIYNTELAEELGIDNWDDTQPAKEQASRIRERINKIFTAAAATGQPEKDTVRTNLAAIEGQLGIVPDNENDLDARFQSIQQHLQQHLQQQEKLTHKEVWNRLTNFEGQQHLQHIQKLEKQKNRLQEFKQKVDHMPTLREKVRDPLLITMEDYNFQLADELGIELDVFELPEEQARLVSKKIRKISKSEQPQKEAVKKILASIESEHGITPKNENDLAGRFETIQQELRYQLQAETDLIDNRIHYDLADIEGQFGLFPDNVNDLEYRQYTLQQHLKQQIAEVGQEYHRQLDIRTEAEKIAATKARFATIATHLNIQDFDSDEDIDVQQERLLEKIQTMEAQQKILFQRVEALNDQQDIENSYIRGQQKAKPEVPETLSAVEEARAAKKAVKNDSGPFQLSPRQKHIQYIMSHIVQQHPLKKQALEAAMGLAELAELAVKSGKEIPDLTTLDFDDKFAPIRLQAMIGEGLISKIELENYIKAARGVDGYQTVAEFEHFLGYRHGVKLPHFKSVVQMLSDEGVEEFIKSAFTPVTVTVNGPAGIKESLDGMKEYATAVIANYVLDDIAFDNGQRTAAFLTNIQDTLKPYANAVGMSETDLINIIHDTLMQVHAAAIVRQLLHYWVKPSAFLVQTVTWYYSSYKPLLVAYTHWQAAKLSLVNMSFLYLLDLTNRGVYLHRMLTPFQHWLESYGVDLDRTGQYAYHSGIEQISEVGGLAMPLGKAASSVILLRTGSALFARQYNANPQSYRSLSRLVPEIVKSMGSGQGVQMPLLNSMTPEKVKTLASATAGLVLGPIATIGTYVQSLISGFTYTQTFGFALASGLTFDFFMNDNKMLTQWLGGPLGRSLDRINRWRGVGESQDEYVKRTTIATPQRYGETDEEYANRVKTGDTAYGWTRHENYLQFRERRDRTMKLSENSWEKYFRENVPKWSFSNAESIPYSYTLGAFFESGAAAPEQPSATLKGAPVGGGMHSHAEQGNEL
ncbi:MULTISPECIES: hypothetical protein [unclassified Endozoicomonas]|uniref:hypothetical protein n=2 Tax=Endozoicomonas TaxID=305899 RepID=UPI003BB51DE5